jgi:hypothetical protein
MINAIEWFKNHGFTFDDKITIKDVQDLQHDAWMQGMDDAAQIANSARCRVDANNTPTGIQVCLMHMIRNEMTNRDEERSAAMPNEQKLSRRRPATLVNQKTYSHNRNAFRRLAPALC